jgi:ASC-1-like (ASCH) protein
VCVLTLLLGIAPLLRAADSTEPPKKEPAPRNPRADGLITAIDADKRTIEVQVTKDKKMTIAVGDEVRLRKDDADIKFGDLAVGNFVVFSYRIEGDKTLVRSITVHDKQPYDHDGTVVSVNKETNCIEVQTGKTATNVYHCSEKTKISKGEKTIELADIAAGNYVKIRFTKDGNDRKNALRVTVFDKKPEKAEDDGHEEKAPESGEKESGEKN